MLFSSLFEPCHDFEARVVQAKDAKEGRDALLDRAAFYLLWQSGLRLGELEELRLEDLDLGGKKLMVRKGKGQSDRSVFLTETTIKAVQAYLVVRGIGPTDHLFFYRNQPLCKGLMHARIKAAGIRVAVHVYPHRLRHTCATQLLNAGCRITSIQKFLGHRRLNTTLIYARVHDQTMADDYFSAMGRIEQRLDLVSEPEKVLQPIPENEREQLITLVNRLAEPELPTPTRLELVGAMQALLNGGELVRSPPVLQSVLAEI